MSSAVTKPAGNETWFNFFCILLFFCPGCHGLEDFGSAYKKISQVINLVITATLHAISVIFFLSPSIFHQKEKCTVLSLWWRVISFDSCTLFCACTSVHKHTQYDSSDTWSNNPTPLELMSFLSDLYMCVCMCVCLSDLRAKMEQKTWPPKAKHFIRSD